MTSNAPLGWALIGASTVAGDHMIPAIRAVPGNRVVGILSSSLERGRRYAAANDIPLVYHSLDDALSDPAVGVAYISTTNDRHAAEACAAARAGRHVLCEKPLATRLDDARTMLATAREAGVVLATNHHLRSTAPLIALRDALAGGAIGEPLAARVFHAKYLPPPLQGWRLQRPEAGAGVVLDLTVHDADTLRFLLREDPVEVTAMATNQGLALDGVEDGVMGVMRFPSGVLASFHDAFTIRNAPTGLEIHGAEGSLIGRNVLGPGPIGDLILRRGGFETVVNVGGGEDPYEHTVRRFADAVRGTGTPTASGWDGVWSLAVALAVSESARTGRAISLAVGADGPGAGA